MIGYEMKRSVRCSDRCSVFLAIRNDFFPEDSSSVGQKRCDENTAENNAADDFTCADGKGEKPEGTGRCIGITQDQWDDDGVGDYRRQRAQETMTTQKVGEDCTDQGCQCTEYDIRQSASCQNVREKTANRDTRNGSRCEKRQDREHLRETNLNGTAGQIKAGCKGGENNVDGCDERSMNTEQNLLMMIHLKHDIQISFSFVRVGRNVCLFTQTCRILRADV